jgi:murein DD-endopeptidase MepM/ murein hydrolase activator NlpD
MVSAFAPVVVVNGVRVAVGPVRGACLSSGYGPRNSRLHKGVDYHSDVGGPVLAGGDGVVVEMVYRNDYGNMLLIDHGDGVYTRYAHLASFAPRLTLGVAVAAGEQIGLMGNTGAYAIPVHLHYEVLTGDYGTPKKSFGLTSVDPFAMPSAT